MKKKELTFFRGSLQEEDEKECRDNYHLGTLQRGQGAHNSLTFISDPSSKKSETKQFFIIGS